jgi:hypothetical protein
MTRETIPGKEPGQVNNIVVTIPNGAAGLSTEYDLGGAELMAILMPATWVAANITFQASNQFGGTYYDLYDDAGSEVVVTAAQQRCISCDSVAMKLAPLRWIKIRSGTTAVPVNQTADRYITLLTKV